ncbi:hypothetical protein QNO07_20820 [Streptomyces sp. 549]|uniref:hypothetical protein n=1 Tax=Streptomyces sp. 549 TaxID=3049076 RepID=UPI0024C3D095|nr:hypothetical protein [Streptomyces sp. 549]MDK1475831.1 hypothetical protein [Streptomyces sp. 549]
MTVPEENRPKTQKTEDVLGDAQHTPPEPQGASGRTMREALEEADVSPDDFTEN